ncbi:hypothetical protein OHA63_34475 [Streptomyces anulatus]|uniref:hypothetical protein n=1 Tax=Streptomyces anulatus TaxID=1892 RepID=UPI002E369453|nr:hypothetical protein [Streptomyces anulatus]
MADILPATAAERAPGPATGGRVVHASLARAAAQMIHDLFEQAESRTPAHRRRVARGGALRPLQRAARTALTAEPHRHDPLTR